MSTTWPVAIIGSGNIGTDLMIKVLRQSEHLELAAVVGVDPNSDGLARAGRMRVATTSGGVDAFVSMAEASEVKLVFDATSATAHRVNAATLEPLGVQLVDMTPAAIGPYVVPVINLDEHAGARNVNMVTCGGQATVPIVAAVSSVTPVRYAEIVSSISSRSAGPGTRANIDEFTETTARALSVVGGAGRGKAVIILNPAEPPMLMRNTVYCLVEGDVDRAAIEAAIESMVSAVQAYVPGYRLKQDVQFEEFEGEHALRLPGEEPFAGVRITVFLQVEGAGHHLPEYAGNLDIMTSAAMATAERIAARSAVGVGALP